MCECFIFCLFCWRWIRRVAFLLPFFFLQNVLLPGTFVFFFLAQLLSQAQTCGVYFFPVLSREILMHGVYNFLFCVGSDSTALLQSSSELMKAFERIKKKMEIETLQCAFCYLHFVFSFLLYTCRNFWDIDKFVLDYACRKCSSAKVSSTLQQELHHSRRCHHLCSDSTNWNRW